MQAITIQQPWAWAVAAGHKTIENRSRCVWSPGRLAVHAGGRWSARGAHDERLARALLVGAVPSEDTDLEYLVARLARRGLPRHDRIAFPAGAVIGVVTLVDSHPDDGSCCRPWGESAYAEGAGRIRTDVVHLTLADPVTLPAPVPCPGQLGRWVLPPVVERAVADQLEAVLA